MKFREIQEKVTDVTDFSEDKLLVYRYAWAKNSGRHTNTEDAQSSQTVRAITTEHPTSGKQKSLQKNLQAF